VKTTAADFTGTNTAAEVAISADGAYLYASNRGEDSLVVFAIKPKDGSLSFVQRISCGGKIPRQFTLDPSGNWLVCANQGSASVTVFRREVPTGKLEGPVQTLPLDSPQFALFATS
jgi:6-phosphogluconolactonase